MTTDPAVTAAAEAIYRADHPHYTLPTPFTDNGPEGFNYFAMARAAVAAARPIIEAEVRERIAAEIEADCLRRNHHWDDWGIGKVCGRCENAARIARGTA